MNYIEKILGKDGIISRYFPKYEFRQSQVEMANCVYNTFTNNGVILVEAGTGTGKTLSYLCSCILSNRQTIISTATKNLQDQILLKDIPLLEKSLGKKINSFTLKGVSNYICLRKFYELSASPALFPFMNEKINLLSKWVEKTKTGDKSELDTLEENDPIWNEVASSPETRLGSKCSFYDRCFVSQARKKALESELVIINHHLFFAELSTRYSDNPVILPDCNQIIFDEAHQIEEIAKQYLGERITLYQLKTIINNIVRMGLTEKKKSKKKLVEFEKTIEQQSINFFSSLLPDSKDGRYLIEPPVEKSPTMESYHDLDNKLELFDKEFTEILPKNELVMTLKLRMKKYRDNLHQILIKRKNNYVYWLEKKGGNIIIQSTPLQIDEILREKLFYKYSSILLTSATLTINNSFAHIKNRLGIDFPVEEKFFDSPFNYKEQMAIYVPKNFPFPDSKDFQNSVAEEILELNKISKGGMLILFTSYQNMDSVFSILSKSSQLRIMRQGDAPKYYLLEKLKNEKIDMLFATASFWEGVDIAGQALRMVVIDKLPFASPTDPLTGAQIKLLKEMEIDPFKEYQLPEAVLSLKQGVGRLIRGKNDWGVITILDTRINKKWYGKTFWHTLPRAPIFSDRKHIEKWWINKITKI